MNRIKVILADRDEIYLSGLMEYCLKNVPQFELNVYTDRDKLDKYFENGGTADICIVDEHMADNTLVDKSNGAVCIDLSGNGTEITGYSVIKKYQKSESLLNGILLKYAELTGASESVTGKSSTRVACFYSPAGGTGKTVLSLGTSVTAAAMGLKTLYLGLEEIDSLSDCLPRTQGSMSDIFLALKTKGMNAGLKLATDAVEATPGGFYYVSGVDSISEYEEIDGSDMAKLIDDVIVLKRYDIVVVDLSSGFGEKTAKLMEKADNIMVPVTTQTHVAEKMKRLLNESNLHDRYTQLFNKMRYIANRDGADNMLWPNNGIYSAISCCARIPEAEIFRNYSSVIHSASALTELFAPVVSAIAKV